MADPALRLLHITDTHLFADTGRRLRGVDTWRSLNGVLQVALAEDSHPDAVLVTGDLSQDETPDSYRHLHRLLAPLGVPVLCVPGNHDVATTLVAELAGPPFLTQGSLVLDRWLLLLLDSTIPGEHGGRLGPAQLAWLRDMLARHRGHHALIALHHHVLPLGSRWLDQLGLADAGALLAELDRSSQVRALLSGHVHQASDTVHNGVRFLTTPSTCFQFLPHSEEFALDARPPAYRWLELHADGRLDTAIGWDRHLPAAAGHPDGGRLVYAATLHQPAEDTLP
ncbi:MAG: 3',5'-cyclic-AMP phosphodiesterase [Gammaproteobacteria bacterium]|nr:3',5'-cyclic-AMP phosphodiesterase [Gammaproteobacteria bacterium]